MNWLHSEMDFVLALLQKDINCSSHKMMTPDDVLSWLPMTVTMKIFWMPCGDCR